MEKHLGDSLRVTKWVLFGLLPAMDQSAYVCYMHAAARMVELGN